jgi:hypothetical protein
MFKDFGIFSSFLRETEAACYMRLYICVGGLRYINSQIHVHGQVESLYRRTSFKSLTLIRDYQIYNQV